MLLAIIPRGDVELSGEQGTAASVPSQGQDVLAKSAHAPPPLSLGLQVTLTWRSTFRSLQSGGLPPWAPHCSRTSVLTNEAQIKPPTWLFLSNQPHSGFQLLDSVLWTPEQPLKQPAGISLTPLLMHLSEQNCHLFPVAQGTKSRVLSVSSHIQHLVSGQALFLLPHSIALESCKRFASGYLYFIL